MWGLVQPQAKDVASQPGDVGDVVVVAVRAVDPGGRDVAGADHGFRHNGKSATAALQFSQIRILRTG